MKLCSLLIKGFTGQHLPYAGAIICPVEAKHKVGETVKAHMKDFKAGEDIDCFELDYRLASHLKKLDPADIYALGVTIRVNNIPGPAGGVIGSLSRRIASARGISQDLGNGLSVAAYPGGPGLVVRASPEMARNLLKSVNPGDEGLVPLLVLKNKILENSISLGIMLTDGTGVEKPGAALCINDRSVNYYQLPGEKVNG